MKIIIVGGGIVGSYLSEKLLKKGHDITVIDYNDAKIRHLSSSQNIRTIYGDATLASTLDKANVCECDFFLAVTNDDKSNILSCAVAYALGAKKTMARVHDQLFADTSLLNYQLHFSIDKFINPDALTANKIAQAIQNTRSILIENFASGTIEIIQCKASSISNLINKRIKDLNLQAGIRIVYILRKEEHIPATPTTEIQEGDVITIIGKRTVIYALKELISPETSDASCKIILFGGTEIAINIIRLLNPQKYKIRLIENNTKLCMDLAERFPHITVIEGHGSSLSLLKEEDIQNCDFFIACTKDDEDNVMTCLLAKYEGAKKVMSVIRKTDYEKILNALQNQINLVIIPRLEAAKEVLHFLNISDHQELYSLSNGKIKIIEILIPTNSPICNKKLSELQLPPGMIIALLKHKYNTKVPSGDDKIIGGDRIIVICQGEDKEILLQKVFSYY